MSAKDIRMWLNIWKPESHRVIVVLRGKGYVSFGTTLSLGDGSWYCLWSDLRGGYWCWSRSPSVKFDSSPGD